MLRLVEFYIVLEEFSENILLAMDKQTDNGTARMATLGPLATKELRKHPLYVRLHCSVMLHELRKIQNKDFMIHFQSIPKAPKLTTVIVMLSAYIATFRDIR